MLQDLPAGPCFLGYGVSRHGTTSYDAHRRTKTASFRLDFRPVFRFVAQHQIFYIYLYLYIYKG